MKQQKNNFIIYVVLIQFFSIYSSNEFPQISDNCNVPQHTVSFDSYQNTQSSNKVIVSCGVKELPNTSYMQRANHSIIDCYGSVDFKNHFVTVITALMYEVAIENYRVAIPGYTSAHGLRDCINALSTFNHSDKTIIENFKSRLESYCSRIEDVVCDRHNAFGETINHTQQIALAHIYADFLKEFYAESAPYLFYEQSQKNVLMQKVMPQINWHWYDGRNYTSSQRTVEQRYANSVNGNLGAVHKALKAGDSATAYNIGKQRVKTEVSGILWGTREKTTSVFEQYPTLRKVVEQKYSADKAKAKQERVAQQKALQQQAAIMKKEYEELFACSNEEIFNSVFANHPDLFANRYDLLMLQLRDSQFYEKLHKILMEHTFVIKPKHLTSDKTGILIEGGLLQHYLTEEAITVADAIVSKDLDNKTHDAVIDLVNESITLTKKANVIMASHLLDACWMLLDYGSAAVEGAALGAYSAATDIVTHPVGTIINTVAGKYVLMYDIGKVFCNVADIGVTALIDADQGQAKWDAYTQPVNDVIDGISKGKITGRDIVKCGSAFIAGIVTHGKVVGKLRNFGNTIKEKTIDLIRENSVIKPPAYVTTPEGLFLKSDIDPNKIKEAGKIVPTNSLVETAGEAGEIVNSGFEAERKIVSVSEKMGHVEIKNPVLNNVRTGKALKKDAYHAFNDMVDNHVGMAKEFDLNNQRDGVLRKLYQLEGSLDGIEGIFEWIVDPNQGVTHRVFVKGAKVTGVANAW